MKSSTKLLLLLLVLAFILRFYNAGGLSGGDDSSYAMWMYYALDDPFRLIYLSFPDEPIFHTGNSYLRPLALYPMLPFVYLFGYNHLALRFASLLFAPLSVWLLYKLSRRFFSENISLLAVFFFVVSPLSIAFSRLALIESALTVYMLAAILFTVIAIQDNKPWLFYLAGFITLINLLTTNFRGAVPLIGLVPFVLMSKLKKRHWKHLIAAGVIFISLYVGYAFLPYMWGETAYADRLLYRVDHGAGDLGTSLGSAVPEIATLMYLTPFMGLILVPAIFGIVYSIRRRKPIDLLLLTALASTAFFYLQGAPWPVRQTIYVPIMAIFAGIGIMNSKRISMLICYTLAWYIAMFIAALTIIPQMTFTRGLFGASLNSVLLLSGTFILILLILPYFTKAKKIIRASMLIFLLINITVPMVLVVGGLSIYHRPDKIHDVADYMEQNLDDEAWGCVAGYHQKTLTYLLQRKCALWHLIDVNWLETQKQSGDLKYLLINLDPAYISYGLGRFNPDGSPDMTNVETDPRLRNYDDKIQWVIENSVDITEVSIGVNEYFRIRRVI